MKVPFLPYPTANTMFENDRGFWYDDLKVIEAVRKESIRIFLSTGRIIPDGHLNNFLYDAKNNTAHCIDHDFAHTVWLTDSNAETTRDTLSSNKKQKELFKRNFRCDETGVGRALNHFVKDNVIKRPVVDEALIGKISDEVSKNSKIDIYGAQKKEIRNFANALKTAIFKSGANPLFAVQSDIRAYVNLRLGSDTTLQGVQGAKPKSWQGTFNKEGKLSSLKNLLKALSECPKIQAI